MKVKHSSKIKPKSLKSDELLVIENWSQKTAELKGIGVVHVSLWRIKFYKIIKTFSFFKSCQVCQVFGFTFPVRR